MGNVWKDKHDRAMDRNEKRLRYRQENGYPPNMTCPQTGNSIVVVEKGAKPLHQLIEEFNQLNPYQDQD